MRPRPEGCSRPRCAPRLSPEVFGWLPVIASPELLAVLSVEIDRPHPVNLAVRPEAAHVNGKIVEFVPAGGFAGLVNQVDDHAVVGVRTATVLVERVAQGGGELNESQGHVLLAARDVPRAGSGTVLEDYLVRQHVEGRPVVSQAAGVGGSLGPDEVGVVVRCGVRQLCHAWIVAPGPSRNICHLADAGSRSWGILNQSGHSCPFASYRKRRIPPGLAGLLARMVAPGTGTGRVIQRVITRSAASPRTAPGT